MVKLTTNWESVETWQRLVASMIASGVKVDLRLTAIYFGATYDTLENRLRKVKKEAATLEAEVDGGERGEAVTPSRSKSAPTTPRKPKTPNKGPLETVANGRVSKKTPNKKTAVKQEQSGSDASTEVDNLPDLANIGNTTPDIAMDLNMSNGLFNGGLGFDDEEFFN